MNNFIKKYYIQILALIVLTSLVYFAIFLHLSSYSLREWDESRLACNALEMIKTGNPVVTYFNGSPDMWNTKPPFMIWMQVLSIKIFGYNELAIRMPSALSVISIIILFFWIAVKHLKKIWIGFISSMVLITSYGFMGNHIARTGDYDALLSFWIIFYSLMFYLYLENPNKNKYLYLFFIGITFSLLTKGIAGLIPVPFFLIFIFYKKMFLSLIRNKHFYCGILIFIFLGLGYYILREYLNNGFIRAVINNELGGRFAEANEEHKGSFNFYYKLLWGWRYGLWMKYLIASIVVAFVSFKFKIINNRLLFIFCLLSALFYFFIISFAQTKLYWYDAPLYPFFALMLGIFFVETLQYFNKKINIIFIKYILILLIIFIFYEPYKLIIINNLNPDNGEYQHINYGYHFRESYLPDNFIIAKSDYSAHIKFYIDVYQMKGYKVSKKKVGQVKTGDKVLVCENKFFNEIEEIFDYQIIKENLYGKFLVIKSEKSGD
ncbi:MAG: glycosyltransferase family 39 protein [Bacteroidales bacterium]|nr:glycosyltransferase family 39 protein [Bacteroidales bacterium]